MTYKLSSEDLARCHARIEDAINTPVPDMVWGILRNNDNVESRKHVKALDPSCPAYNAPMKAWRAWVEQKFPQLASIEAKKSAEDKVASEKRQAEWRARQLEALATSGPRFVADGAGTTYSHALAYVRSRKAEGFTPVREGIGCYSFVKGDVRSVAKRNKHLNAAIALVFGE